MWRCPLVGSQWECESTCTRAQVSTGAQVGARAQVSTGAHRRVTETTEAGSAWGPLAHNDSTVLTCSSRRPATGRCPG